jgi:hypothetical protein
LSIRHEACANKRIDPAWFGNHQVQILTGDGSDPNEKSAITVQPEVYSHQKLTTQAYNLLFAAMGTMAAVVYEAANDAGLRDVNKSPTTVESPCGVCRSESRARPQVALPSRTYSAGEMSSGF